MSDFLASLQVIRTVAIGTKVTVNERPARVLRRRDVHLVVEYDDGSVEVIDPYDSESPIPKVRIAS